MKNEKDRIFGFRPIIEAIKAGKEIEKIFIKKGLTGDLYQELFTLVRQSNIPFQFVPIEKINHITTKNHQGVIAFISQIEYQDIEKIVPGLFEAGKTPFLLIVDRVTDVRNFGAISRSAECAGIDAIIIPIKGSAEINTDAIKTSSGALHSVHISRSNDLPATIEYLKNCGIKIIAAHEKSKVPYYKENFNIPVAILMGSEETGISRELLSRSDAEVSIPVFGTIASLNVSVACGVILYEAVRQRSL